VLDACVVPAPARMTELFLLHCVVQVNTISSDELRDLFSLRTDTASDTHDTLRCKRCNYVKVKEASKKGKAAAMTPAQAEGCVAFLDAFTRHLQQEAFAHAAKQGAATSSAELVVLPFMDEVVALQEALRAQSYPSLPAYSKAQRDAIQGIEGTMQQAKLYKPRPPAAEGVEGGGAEAAAEEAAEAALYAAYQQLFPPGFSLFAEFLNRWVEAVPQLTLLGKASAATASSSTSGAAAGGEEGDEEVPLEGSFVEQEGCPDDTDFNRWSHHCNVASCDDEVLQRSLADDPSTVSFVFGLEVNWSLLEAKEAATREEKELRKEQQRLELAALNEARRLKREGITAPVGCDDIGADDLEDGGTAAASKKKKGPSGKRKTAALEEGAEGDGSGSDGEGAERRQKKKAAKKSKIPTQTPGADPTGTVEAALSPPPRSTAAGSNNTNSAVPGSGSRRRQQLHQQHGSGDLASTVDDTFRADWEFLKRARQKGKIPDWRDFGAVLKQLKVFNNNWRIVPGTAGETALIELVCP
jgi:hypothetical protein